MDSWIHLLTKISQHTVFRVCLQIRQRAFISYYRVNKSLKCYYELLKWVKSGKLYLGYKKEYNLPSILEKKVNSFSRANSRGLEGGLKSSFSKN